MNSKMTYMKSIIDDYAEWDDTYNYINEQNQDYIDENFRDGTNTLIGLDLDFIIYTNLKQKKFFSIYLPAYKTFNTKKLENSLFDRFDNTPIANTIFKYKSSYFYIIKSKILKSDSTGKSNGYLFAGKKILNTSLENLSKNFTNIKIKRQHSKDITFSMDYKYLNRVSITVHFDNSFLHNNIQIFDNEKNYIFSLITLNNRDIVSKGVEAIIIYNIIISVFLFIIFFILYKNKLASQRYNEKLEAKIKEKTNLLSREIKKVQKKNEKLFTLANKDTLTNIDNRRSFFTKSKNLLEKAIQNDTTFSLLMIDLDNFKKINDTYGHHIGDKVLIEFCNIVNKVISKNTIFARIGGEEFSIIFSNPSLEEVYSLADSIRENCESSQILYKDEFINFTISIGLTQRNDFKNIDKVLQEADIYLYEAKNSGKNKIMPIL